MEVEIVMFVVKGSAQLTVTLDRQVGSRVAKSVLSHMMKGVKMSFLQAYRDKTIVLL